MVYFNSCYPDPLLIAERQQEESSGGRYGSLPACLWSSLTFWPEPERTSEIQIQPTSSPVLRRMGMGFVFPILLNNHAVAASGLQRVQTCRQLELMPQGFSSNCIPFDRSRDRSSLEAVENAYSAYLKVATWFKNFVDCASYIIWGKSLNSNETVDFGQ